MILGFVSGILIGELILLAWFCWDEYQTRKSSDEFLRWLSKQPSLAPDVFHAELWRYIKP